MIVIFKIYFFLAKAIVRSFVIPIQGFYTVLYVFFIGMKRKKNKSQPKLFWGPVAIINNKYYSQAMQNAGYDSKTFMTDYFSINKRDDYDWYVEDYAPKFISFFALDQLFKEYYGFFKCFRIAVKNFDIHHMPFTGGFLQKTFLSKWEAQLLKRAGCKTVILGYGSDFYRYSKVLNLSWLHGILTHYPQHALNEDKIERNVSYWRKHADCVINGMQIDHLGRWDVLPFRAEAIDTENWKQRETYSNYDGKNGVVRIAHSSNHRVLKGTEFILQAVKELKEEGLLVELTIIEKMPNEEVKRILIEETDICFDQLNLGYAMSAIEAMAIGLPVMTNLENEDYVQVFRRYSFLNECPMLSVSHETLKDQLRILVRNPELRESLGKAGRKYVEKYHSFTTAKYVFGKVYDKIWFGKSDVDLINLFHPLFSNSYNNQTPKVLHPLVANKIPKETLEKLNSK